MIILVSWLDNKLKFSFKKNIYINIYNISKDIQFYPTPTTRKQQVWTGQVYWQSGSDNSKENGQESKAWATGRHSWTVIALDEEKEMFTYVTAWLNIN